MYISASIWQLVKELSSNTLVTPLLWLIQRMPLMLLKRLAAVQGAPKLIQSLVEPVLLLPSLPFVHKNYQSEVAQQDKLSVGAAEGERKWMG